MKPKKTSVPHRRSAGGHKGTNKFASAPKGSKGSPGGKMHGRLSGGR